MRTRKPLLFWFRGLGHIEVFLHESITTTTPQLLNQPIGIAIANVFRMRIGNTSRPCCYLADDYPLNLAC
jgi:hypothetical protein